MRIIFFILTLFMFISCGEKFSNGVHEATTYEIDHPITLVKKKSVLDIPYDPQVGELSESRRAEIMSFLYSYSADSEGKLLLSIPENFMHTGQTRQLVKKITDMTLSSGIEKSNIFIESYASASLDKAVVKMAFKRLIAEGPDCRDKWSQNFTDAFRNLRWKGLGCATRSNLAAMIAHPKDLIEMQSMTPAPAVRKILSIDAYHQRQLTGVQASSQ